MFLFLYCLIGVIEVFCGLEYNLVVIGGVCYFWGWNEYGMCGDGIEVNIWVLKLV